MRRKKIFAISSWKLWFILPGDQTVTTTKQISQQANTVTVSSAEPLAPRKVANVSGATIMGDGRVALILDVGALVRLSRH